MRDKEEERHVRDIGESIAELQFVSNGMKEAFNTHIEAMGRRAEEGVSVFAKLDKLNSDIDGKFEGMAKTKGSRMLPHQTYQNLTTLMGMVEDRLKEAPAEVKKKSTKPSASMKMLIELKEQVTALSTKVESMSAGKHSPEYIEQKPVTSPKVVLFSVALGVVLASLIFFILIFLPNLLPQ